MLKRTVTLALAGSAFVVGLSCLATSAFAFGGCVTSPENPTWILAGIGGAAASIPWLRSVVRRHRGKSDK